jgi:hypothetical protein
MENTMRGWHAGVMAVAIVSLLALTGCPPVGSGNLPDPPGTAPELKGDWNFAPTVAGTSGFPDLGDLSIDATGDLKSLSGNKFLQSQLGVDTLTFDGVWRPADFGGTPIEYAPTAAVTNENGHVTLNVVITVRAYGVNLGTYSVVAQGTQNGDTITGTVTENATLPGYTQTSEPVPGTLTRAPSGVIIG